MDRRQKKTREAIFRAFTSLLSKKNYHQITVQDILDTADVGRTTFYAHFETKEYLLRDLCADLFGHVTDTALGQVSCACGDAADSVFLHLVRHLRQNDRGILDLLSSENDGLFLDYFRGEVCRLVESTYGARLSIHLPRDYLVQHIAAAFVQTVRWWLSEECTRSPEEVTACFLAVTEPLLTADDT
ncbi:MAG: TetR/AcrR family transcriptional regulator [Clostridia bacterium]|nr:TetR/AcrR family transcriptional regulator [Clostridia bacterium]